MAHNQKKSKPTSVRQLLFRLEVGLGVLLKDGNVRRIFEGVKHLTLENELQLIR